MALVTLEILDGVATVTLRRSDKLNSLNEQMIAQLRDALEAGAAGSRAVILRAEPGVKVFSAGHDLDEVPVHAQADEWDNPVETLITGIAELPAPVIAAVEGSVWGAATNLVVACDLIIATDDASFAITPAKLGVPYFSGGVSVFARSLPLHVVKAMFYTAMPLSARDGQQFGLVHEVVPDGPSLTSCAEGLARRIAGLAPLTVRGVKTELAAIGVANEAGQVMAQARDDLRRAAWASADLQEGVQAFRERRRPEFAGE